MRLTWILEAFRTILARFRQTDTQSNSSARPSTEDRPLQSRQSVTDNALVDQEGYSQPSTVSGTSVHVDNDDQVEVLGNSHNDEKCEPKGPVDKQAKDMPDPKSNEQDDAGSESQDFEEYAPTSNQFGSNNTRSTKSPAEDEIECHVQGGIKHSNNDDLDGRIDNNLQAKTPRKPKPSEIGGRRDRQPPQQPARTESIPNLRPELICRRVAVSATWEVVVKAEQENRIGAAFMNGEVLEHTATTCRVPSLTGSLIVQSQHEECNLALFEDNPLIFKLRKNWSGEGRKIGKITNGYFIVLAPNSWNRTGHPPVEPDACADPGFLAHYFYREATNSDTSTDGFRELDYSLVTTGIELTGNRAYDDSDLGDLFIGDGPRLGLSSDIVWARVGQEAERGWGCSFLPEEISLSEVMDEREGRFFLRVYNSEAKLLDSTVFRYFRHLKQIHLDGAEYSRDLVVVPTPLGHPVAEVCFIGTDDSTISPSLPPRALQNVTHSGAVVVPPHPDADRIPCKLKAATTEVDILVDLPRVWWRLEEDGLDPGPWCDTPLAMKRQDFREFAHSNVTLALLSKRFQSVRAGFDEEFDRRYRRNATDHTITIPLRDFVDHAQIDTRQNADVNFNVEWSGEAVSIIVISADPMPEIVSFTAEPSTILVGQEAVLKWTTRNALDAKVAIDQNVCTVDGEGTLIVRPTDTTSYRLTLSVLSGENVSCTVTVVVVPVGECTEQPNARVMAKGDRWRHGKGFSLSELRIAGINPSKAMDRSLAIDKRRRTLHLGNVERVRRIFDD